MDGFAALKEGRKLLPQEACQDWRSIKRQFHNDINIDVTHTIQSFFNTKTNWRSEGP